MTVSSTKSAVSYQGDGATVRFDFLFPMPSGTAKVLLTMPEPDGSYDVEEVSPDLYVITGEDNPDGGYVTFSSAPPASKIVTIKRVLPLVQPTELVTGAGFYPEVVEGMGDRDRMIDQQLAEMLERSVKVPDGSGLDPDSYFDLIMGAKGEAEGSAGEADASAAASAAEAAASAALAQQAAASASSSAASAAGAGQAAADAALSASEAAIYAAQANADRMTWRGEWDAATTYIYRDTVYFEGSTYIAEVENTNVEPGDPSTWGLVALGASGAALATTTEPGLVKIVTDDDAAAGTLAGAFVISPKQLKDAIPGLATNDVAGVVKTVSNEDAAAGELEGPFGISPYQLKRAVENAGKTVELTQAEYDALDAPDPDTVYFITDGEDGGIPAPDGLGYGQTWQSLTTQRDFNTTYTNTTDKPIIVNAQATVTATNHLYLVIDNVGACIDTSNVVGLSIGVSNVVPSGSTYRVNTANASINKTEWSELR
ncbi:hypothetical protein FACS1894205_3200 [Alphaproteobacteria bacterium]|nr:hypothetical protein FACS1894205_3200 [Alphaproteobacteria bacterium]